MIYLLDTNVLSEAVKTEPDKQVMTKVEKHQDEIVTAAPVWHELQFGCQRLPRSRKREIIASFLNDIVRRTMPILPYDDRAVTPSFVDGQIASIAGVNGLILVTRNIDDFKPFSKLKLENWHSA